MIDNRLARVSLSTPANAAKQVRTFAAFLCLALAPANYPVTPSSAEPYLRHGLAQETRRSDSSSITGRVLSEDGPLAGASVRISSVGRPNTVQPVITDQDGNFEFSGLQDVAYYLSISSLGYVAAPPLAGVEPAPLYYYPGDRAVVRLVRGGVITGKVTGPDDAPIVSIPVSAIRVRDASGRLRTSGQTQAQRKTDDRGVYRLYGLPAGSYLVAAGGGEEWSPFRSETFNYYPASARDSAA